VVPLDRPLKFTTGFVTPNYLELSPVGTPFSSAVVPKGMGNSRTVKLEL
jgi:hypothetical protein